MGDWRFHTISALDQCSCLDGELWLFEERGDNCPKNVNKFRHATSYVFDRLNFSQATDSLDGHAACGVGKMGVAVIHRERRMPGEPGAQFDETPASAIIELNVWRREWKPRRKNFDLCRSSPDLPGGRCGSLHDCSEVAEREARCRPVRRRGGAEVAVGFVRGRQGQEIAFQIRVHRDHQFLLFSALLRSKADLLSGEIDVRPTQIGAVAQAGAA